MSYPGDVKTGNTARTRLVSFALTSLALVQLTEAHPCDDLAHGAIHVL